MEANPLKVLSSETKKGQPERWKGILKELYQENTVKEFLVVKCGELQTMLQRKLMRTKLCLLKLTTERCVVWCPGERRTVAVDGEGR